MIYIRAYLKYIVAVCAFICAPLVYGAAAKIAVSGGNSQTGVVGTLLPTQLNAVVTDSSGAPVPGATIDWLITSGTGTLGAASGISDSSGMASNTLTLGTTPGYDQVTATIHGTYTKVFFGETAIPGVAQAITASSGDRQSGPVGAPLPASLAVLCTDLYGNPSSRAQVNWVVTSGGGSVPYASSQSSAGIATKVLTLGTVPGVNTVTATVAGTNLSYTFSETGTGASLASNIIISGGNSQTGVVGTPLPTPLTAIATDTNGNPVSGAAIDWSITSGTGTLSTTSSMSNSNGVASNVLTLGTAPGYNQITAKLHGFSAKVAFGETANPGVAQALTVSSGDGQSGTVGAPLPALLAVLCTDQYGNPSSQAQVNWVVTSGGGSVPYASSQSSSGIATKVLTLGTVPGVNTVTATIAGTNLSYTFSATGLVGPAAAITVSSGNAQTGSANSPLNRPFTALVTDVYGNPKQGVPVTWTAVTAGDTLSTQSSNSNYSVLALAKLTLGSAFGLHSVIASVNGTSLSQVFTATEGVNAVVTMQDDPTPSPYAMQPGFVGLSYQKTWLSVPLFNANNAALVTLFKNLGPGVLRIIGERPLSPVPWNHYGAGLHYGEVSQADLLRVAAFAKAVNWKVLYGIALVGNTATCASGSTNCAADEAAVAAKAFGTSLLGFEIGNEPDNYSSAVYGNPAVPQIPGYTYDTYISTVPVYVNGVLQPSWPAFAAAIRAAAPNVPLTGPVSGMTWNLNFANSNQSSQVSLLTRHFYQTNAGQSPTMAQVLTPDPRVPVQFPQLAQAAISANISGGYRISECNTVSGAPVPGVSDAFGAALWTIDFLFSNAAYDSTGINLNGGAGANTPGSYSPLRDDNTNVVAIGPDYYGLFAYSLISKGGSVLITQVAQSPSTFSAYAVLQPDGSTDAILSNKDPINSITVSVIPQGSISEATTLLMTAPSLTATTGFQIGGTPIPLNGNWTPASNPSVPIINNSAVVTVPPASAQIVHMD